MTTETYEPGDLAMVRDVERPALDIEMVRIPEGWRALDTGVWYAERRITVLHRLEAVPADAIVLEKDDEDVEAFITGRGRPVGEPRPSALVADKIRAQITPPETPMKEPTELLERVTDDAGNWVRWSISTRTFEPWAWCDSLGIDTRQTRRWSDLKNPRKFENPREKPATAPQSDEQGSGSGIGRVSESEASEGAQAHAEAWAEWGKRMRAFGDSL